MANLLNWVYSDGKYESESEETPSSRTSESGKAVTEKPRRTSYVKAWSIVCTLIAIFFAAGFLCGYYFRSFEAVDCSSIAEEPLQTNEWNGSQSTVCKANPPPANAPHHNRDWRGSESSRQVGTIISYHCTSNPKSHVYRVVLCDKDLVWRVVIEETGPSICKNRYHVETEVMNYERAQLTCTTRGGELVKTSMLEQKDILRKVIEKGAPKCQQIFLEKLLKVAKEDWGERWWWLSKAKLDLNRTHWLDNYPKGFHRCVVLIRSTMKWMNEDCSKPHCFICEENTGSCFGLGKCLAISYQMTFKYAEISCSNMAHSLVTNFPHSASSMRKLRTAIGAVNPSFCPAFFIGLRLKHRIYRSDVTGAVHSQLLWQNTTDLMNDCVTLNKADNYRYLHAASCESRACSICLFQGPERLGLKDIKPDA